jgi:hypothetical protein
MKRRFFFALLFSALSLMLSGLGSSLLAGALPAARLSSGAWINPDVKRVACGWDYPCPSEPDYGRRPAYDGRRIYRQPGRVYIHNNYGTVNIEVDGHRRFEPAAAPPRPCCEGEASRGGERWLAPCGPAPCAEDRPKEDCGVRCWWHRFRTGYCGHGCWAYREQARIEAEEREYRAERRAEKELAWREEKREREDYPPYFDRGYYPPPPPRHLEREDAPPRYERPKIDERTPLGRFEGPRYPAE